ncbi:MAG: hypothetical protein Q8900_00420 [Bacillota bacterium]|nr:hypothetical protein [Bacillota bacterium]
MFEILYRIIDDINDIKNMKADEFDRNDIDGFFQLRFNDSSYGQYNDITPVDENGYSFEYITKWFENIINAALLLDKNEYVAINDTESFNTWIEIKKVKNDIIVGIIQAEKDGEKQIRTIPFENVKYSEWKEECINLDKFRNEVISKLLMYIDELIRINSNLINSKRLNKLKNNVNIIKESLRN